MAIFQKPEQIHWTYVADLKIDLITSRRIDSREHQLVDFF